MKAVLMALGSVACLLLMQCAVGALHWYEEGVAWVYGRDLIPLAAAVVLLAKTRVSRLVVWLATMLTWFVMLYEWVRAVGLEAMAQEPLLYDAIFLGKHLFFLMSDLLGDEAVTMLWSVVAALVVSLALFRLGFGLMAAASRRGEWLFILSFTLLLVPVVHFAESEESPVTGMDTLADAKDNVAESQKVWESLQRGIDGELYADIASTRLKKKPRVHIYIVESYGRASLRPRIRKQYREYMNSIAKRMSSLGWSMATGLSEAPVMGGRSWLADATMLSGIQIRYESEYRHLAPLFSEMASLPGFFRKQGYETILMRPKDKARPGLELVNYFDYSRTVFADDLDYKGRPYGWVQVPDQFALGHIRDVVMPSLDAPEFVFAHLGSSHIPWKSLPPIMGDWRLLERYPRRINGTSNPQELDEKQVRFQLERFKRSDEVRVRRLRPTAANLDDYFKATSYSMEVVIRHVEAMEDPPDLVVMMGDHQPPLYKKSKDFTVPVHLFALDKKLLREFRKRGFAGGIQPSSWQKRIYHEGFFSLMVRALSKAEGGKGVKYRKRGNNKTKKKTDKK